MSLAQVESLSLHNSARRATENATAEADPILPTGYRAEPGANLIYLHEQGCQDE